MSILERVLDVNTRFPVEEPQKFHVISAANELLAEYAGIEEPSDELTYAIVRLLRYLKRPAAAIDLLETRRPVIAGKARDVDFYEAELLFATGRTEQGEILLRKLEAGGSLRPSWQRSIDKLRQRSGLAAAAQALAQLERDLASLETRVDMAAHRQLLQAVLPEGNTAIEVLAFTRDRIQALACAVPQEHADLTVFGKYHVAKLVFTCGFSWSGSGAVSCYLSQHKDVQMPFGMSELAFIQGRSGRKGIFPLLKGAAIPEAEMRNLLATFLVESIVCLRALKGDHSVLMHCSRAPGGHVGVLGKLLDDFNRLMLAQDALADVGIRKAIVTRFLQRLFSVQGGTHVLLNNVFMAPRASLAGWMEDAVFVAVERDARDQFVARKFESSDADVDSVRAFGLMLDRARSRFLVIRGNMEGRPAPAQLVLLRFEDFVRQQDTRDKLLDRLGLARARLVPGSGKFDPSVSIRNVGIHEEKLQPEEARYIEHELGVYLQ